jgi:dethiobiotin synthetase
MKAIFITGTDTGVGKTVITGLLGRWLKDRGFRVITQKWVQTGSADDIACHLRIMGQRREEVGEYLELMAPYSFDFPSSCHLASELEEREIDPERIKKSFRLLSQEFECVLVEGTGGILVPISKKHLLVDITRELELPVLVVAANRLGAINHTLLTIEALKRREMQIIGVVFNTPSKDQDGLITKDNPEIVEALNPGVILGNIGPGGIEDLYKEFGPIGERIFARWMNG